MFFPSYICLFGPFNYISPYESLSSPDLIHGGWLGSKHQLTTFVQEGINQLSPYHNRVYYNTIFITTAIIIMIPLLSSPVSEAKAVLLSNQSNILTNPVPVGSPSRGGDVAVSVLEINQLSFHSPFYYLPVSVSVSMALSTVFHPLNSPDSSPLCHSVLPVLFLPCWSFQLCISFWKSP